MSHLRQRSALVRALLKRRTALPWLLGALLAMAVPALAATSPTKPEDAVVLEIRARIKEMRFTAAESLARAELARGHATRGEAGVRDATVQSLLARSMYLNMPKRSQEALPLARAALSQHERLLGPDAVEVAQDLGVAAGALAHFTPGDTSAHQMYVRALAILERALPPDDERIQTALRQLGTWDSDRGRSAEADSLLARAARIAERAPGADPMRKADAWLMLGSQDIQQGRLPEAAQKLGRALALADSVLPRSDRRRISYLYRAGLVDLVTGERDRAATRLNASLELAERLGATDGMDLPIIHRMLALQFMWAGDFTRAREFAARSIAGVERVYGSDNDELANSLLTYANVQAMSGSTDSAIAGYARAVPMLERAYGKDHVRVQTARMVLAQVAAKTRTAPVDETALLRTINDLERGLGPRSFPAVGGYISLGDLRIEKGDYEGAEAALRTYFERADSTSNIIMGNAFFSMATLETYTGRYAEAQRDYEEALRRFEKNRDPGVSTALNNLASLMLEMGDRDRAREYHERNVALRRQRSGAQSPELGIALNNYGVVLTQVGDSTAARTALLESIEILSRQGGFQLGGALGSLALLDRDCGRLGEAKREFRRALVLIDSTASTSQPFWPEYAQQLASVLARSGEFEAAAETLAHVRQIRERTLGPAHPLVASTLEASALVRWSMGDAAGAFDEALRAESIAREHLSVTLRGLSERQALRYLQVRASGLDVALSRVAADSTAREDASRAWDAAIAARGLVFEEMALRHRSFAATGDTLTQVLVDSLRRATARLANLSVRPLDKDVEKYRAYLDEASTTKQRLERRLGERSAAFRGEIDRRKIGWREVRAALGPGQVLIAFQRYQALDKRTAALAIDRTGDRSLAPDQSLLAFVQRADELLPRVIPLGKLTEIETLVAAWRLRAERAPSDPDSRAGSEQATNVAGERLRRVVWDPVARVAGSCQQVILVPDDALSLVNFSALPSGAGAYLVESGPLFRYVSSERDLARPTPSGTRAAGMLAMGGPDFDATGSNAGGNALAASTPAARRTGGARGLESGTSAPYRGARSACREFESYVFPPLPGATAEIKDVARLWEARRSAERLAGEPRGAATLLGAEAGEAAFKRLAPGRRIIHLATHAFFLGEHCGGSSSPVTGAGTTSAGLLSENPLLLSGLVLAGANRRAAAHADTDDGVLTAEEVTSLDLTGTDWVVLSACDTGLGVVESGEGVYGLRRAFALAGAHTVITSLWKVDDAATREWVQLLYAARFQQGLSTAEAVRSATVGMLAACRKAGLGPHPSRWAAFIACE